MFSIATASSPTTGDRARRHHRALRRIGSLALAVIVLSVATAGCDLNGSMIEWSSAGNVCSGDLVDLYLDGDTGELLECEGDGAPYGGFTESEATDISQRAWELADDADGLTHANRKAVEDYARVAAAVNASGRRAPRDPPP